MALKGKPGRLSLTVMDQLVPVFGVRVSETWRPDVHPDRALPG